MGGAVCVADASLLQEALRCGRCAARLLRIDAAGAHVHRVEAATGRDEQPAFLFAAEADVGRPVLRHAVKHRLKSRPPTAKLPILKSCPPAILSASHGRQRYRSSAGDGGRSTAGASDVTASLHRTGRRPMYLGRFDSCSSAWSRSTNASSVPPASSSKLCRIACSSSRMGLFIVVIVSAKKLRRRTDQ